MYSDTHKAAARSVYALTFAVTMERWSRDAAARYEVRLRDDIPLQTPMGTYRKPFLKKHGWTLGPMAIVIVLGLVAAFFTPDAKGSPTIVFNFRTDGDVPLEASESEMKAWVFVKDEPREMRLFLTNKGTQPAQIRVASMPASVTGVSTCWRLGNDERCGVDALGILAPGERQPVTATMRSKNIDSSEFDITVIFVSSRVTSP
jgi:hypothetical protein